jgi:hypothetical protein
MCGVIVWLNGPFCVGKTTTAAALLRRLPDAMLYDPEVLGAALRQIAGAVDRAEDFQDMRPWRALVVETARLLRTAYGRALVVPMTVWRRDYADELVAGFRRADPDLRRFRLTVPEEELAAHPGARGDGGPAGLVPAPPQRRPGAHAGPRVRRGGRDRRAQSGRRRQRHRRPPGRRRVSDPSSLASWRGRGPSSLAGAGLDSRAV